MRTPNRVTLSGEERAQVQRLLATGQTHARTLTHAHILLKADVSAGGAGWDDEQIAAAFAVSCSTVGRVRRRYVAQGLDAALQRQPTRRQYPRRLDGDQEAHLVAVACGMPPEGRKRWTLRLLANKAVELEIVEGISYETVRRALKKTR